MRWLVLVLMGTAGGPYTVPESCSGAEYHALDFWLGDWKVTSPEGEKQGTNHIQAILGGCAIREQWTDVMGGQGESFFYYDRSLARWKQVWVTSRGTWKEKTQVDGPSGAVRFQGQVPRPKGGTVLDRTTLTPLPDGGVRQVIEVSADGGKTWQPWEGIYRH